MILVCHLEVKGHTIPVWVVRHWRARRFSLKFDKTHEGLIVTVPRNAALSEVPPFVENVRGWIERHFKGPTHKVRLNDGVVFPIFDETVRLVVSPARRGAVTFQEGVLHVSGKEGHVPTLVRTTLHRLLFDFCYETCHQFAKQLGVSVNKITLRPTTGRWGSCSADGHLSFTTRLIFAPRAVVRYVCAHEVAHLREMNHSPRFWRVVSSLDPAFEAAKKWIKNHGRTTLQYEV